MRLRGTWPTLVAVGLLLAASCGGDDSTAPAATANTSPASVRPESAKVADADELIAVLEDVLGPCVAVETNYRDGRHAGSCTLGSGAVLEVDVWLSDDVVSTARHLYRAAAAARSIECVGAPQVVSASRLAGGNWMIASTDGAVLDEVAERIGGVALEPPDCGRSACDMIDPPWDRIELHATVDGVVPSTVELRADGAELCITSESSEMLDLMFVGLPENYDTDELLSAPVTERQVLRVSTGIRGVVEEPPVSTWLEPGHHLVLIGPPGAAARHAAAIQLRPDLGPAPAYPTLPPTEVVPPAEPLRFLLPDGVIVSGSESDGSGEFLLDGRGLEVSLYWTMLAREPFDEFVDDRRDSGSELDVGAVAGFDAIVVAYSSTDHAAVIHDDTYLYEFVAAVPEAEFRSVLDALTIVSEEEWAGAFSPGMTPPDEVAAVATGMLEGVTIPDTFDVRSLEELDVSGDRYQVAAAVVDRVVCAWLEQWERHPVGSAGREQAIAALADAASWPILVEIERSGGLTDVIREVGVAVRVDGEAVLGYLESCDL